jgi:autotransporter passenger strand-loop-strand repeat protein
MSALTIISGGTAEVLSGGSATGTNVKSGFMVVSGVADLSVVSGTNIAGPQVFANIAVYSGGVTSGDKIYDGGAEDILAGGVASGADVISGILLAYGKLAAPIVTGNLEYLGAGEIALKSGGSASLALVNSGGEMLVSSGGMAVGATVNHSGFINVLAGGSATGTNVKSGYLVVSGVADLSVVSGVNTAGPQVSANVLVDSGGVTSGDKIYFGGVEEILKGGIASGTDVISGILLAYGEVVAPTIIANLELAGYSEIALKSGGVADAAIVNSGGVLVVSSGGLSERATIHLAGSLDVLAGGSATSTSITSAGVSYVFGTVAQTTIAYGGVEVVDTDGVTVSAKIEEAGFEKISAGGIAQFAQVQGSGNQTVFASGTASGTTVSAGGHQYVSGGTARGTIIKAGGSATVYTGGVLISAAVLGTEIIGAGAVASGTGVSNGGAQLIHSAGRAVGTVIHLGGKEFLSSGAVDSGTIIGSGGTEVVSAGASASGANIRDLGSLVIYGKTVSAVDSGSMAIETGATASATVIAAGGKDYVSAGGIDRAAIISAGGMAFIYSAGVISGTKLLSGATLTIAAGGILQAGLTLSGGTAVISGTVAGGQTVRFGGGGDLVLDNLAGFGAVISGFATGAEIDLGGFGYSAGETRSFTEGAGNTSGTLTVIDGATSVQLTLLGNYVTSNFALSTDGSGGTAVKFS